MTSTASNHRIPLPMLAPVEELGLNKKKKKKKKKKKRRMKGLFKSKPKTPAELVRQTRDLLVYLDLNSASAAPGKEAKREEKMAELSKLIRELKSILYGNSESEPISEACAQLTQEFFKENTLRLLISCLPTLSLETRKDATQVVANLQRQQVHSRLIASDYLEANKDLMDILISGYENSDLALHYGAMLRECIRHQTIARYVLESEHMKKFFDYIQLPNFDIASDASATFKVNNSSLCYGTRFGWSGDNDDEVSRYDPFGLRCVMFAGSQGRQDCGCGDGSIRRKGQAVVENDATLELLTRHKSTVAEFLTKNYDWNDMQFFAEYNSKLLESENYITRRQAVKLLGDMLLDRANAGVMMRYVSSKDNLRILMNLLRLFAANQNKPSEIVSILVANRSKILRFFGNFKIDKEDDQFEADKAQVIKEIAALEPGE
ncbi:hypothetical protein Syun_009717 [Stephania yunnanensis]|uniref:MO25-like protein At5g47540 n=1 Tax=Stephania yunnanensis TaxID=152371 RepID=A0AAP0KF17_9MAGN